jgi:asparagine synthase (glutamine-hydrolysing)
MIADVPIGAFLSGGIDSSTIVALMQTQTNRPVKTFTIGFHEDGHNEAEHAKLIAAHIGTDHTEWYVTPEETLEVIPKLPSIWDEPFSDSSQIPTYLVSKLAKQHVAVSLSGDGGDELFCGYTRYTQGYRVWKNTQHLPPSIRKTVAKLIRTTPSNPLEKIMSVLPKKFQVPHMGDRLPKLANVIDSDVSGESYYKTLTSHWLHPSEVVLNSEEPETSARIPSRISDAKHIREQMMYMDSLTYLPDDILTKVDRASMAVSLEGRVPLLDHRIVEFSWRIPMSMKFKSGKGKWLLREVLKQYVPTNLVERPKMGFGVPIESWLRGSLREWAEELLDESRLSQEGYFDPKPIRKLWDEHKTGKRSHHFHLWDVLMFQSWLESNRG